MHTTISKTKLPEKKVRYLSTDTNNRQYIIKMKTVIKFWLKYYRTTKKITASSIPSLVGTPAKEAINSPEVAKIFDDAVGSSHKKVLMFFTSREAQNALFAVQRVKAFTLSAHPQTATIATLKFV